jgi:hypothetical protein
VTKRPDQHRSIVIPYQRSVFGTVSLRDSSSTRSSTHGTPTIDVPLASLVLHDFRGIKSLPWLGISGLNEDIIAEVRAVCRISSLHPDASYEFLTRLDELFAASGCIVTRSRVASRAHQSTYGPACRAVTECRLPPCCTHCHGGICAHCTQSVRIYDVALSVACSVEGLL